MKKFKKSQIIKILLIPFLFCFELSNTSAQNKTLLAYWTFDQVNDRKVQDLISKTEDAITGNFRLVRGVKGRAIVMDGYTTSIIRRSNMAPKMGSNFTIEAWIALGAYPWNWAPIIARENTISLNSNLDGVCWPDDITVNSPTEGFFFGISPEGYLGLHIGNNGWKICKTVDKVPLRTWTHVAATFQNGEGVILYINGKKAAKMDLKFEFHPAKNEDLRIGMPHQKIEPSYPTRAFATLPSWYSIDGLLDELYIYNDVLSEKQITKYYSSSKPSYDPDLPPRIMPSGPAGQGKFGASYMNLMYYPEWDALWPVSSDPDIVVQFDDTPVRVVFWRGTRYSPAWVMENNLWMADQSAENFNNRDGCIEHMLDPHCRYSHVRIIENSDARVVVHWRYAPTSANKNFSQVDTITEWEDWVDEYYTFYPDGVGVRKVIQHTKGYNIYPEEVIVLCQPGQRPEDVIDLSAITLANLKGHSYTYSWAKKTPDISEGRFGNEPEEKPIIMRVNLKSEYKPFQIFETDNHFSMYSGEQRKGFSHFAWFNHWPVAQIHSDGRYCQADDRASHFSMAWAAPPAHKGEKNTYWWVWLYGATKKEPGTLIPLARSWLYPPKLVFGEEQTNWYYDKTQRCYVISGIENRDGRENLSFQLEATKDSPVLNPAFVIENWGDREATLQVNGKEVQRGKNFRTGFIRRVNRYNLVVWIQLESDKKVDISLSPLKTK